MISWFSTARKFSGKILLLRLRSTDLTSLGRDYLSDSKANDLTKRLYTYLDWKVKIPRIRHGNRSSIETLINEEALLLAKYLRNEKKDWVPRVCITL